VVRLELGSVVSLVHACSSSLEPSWSKNSGGV
jgi:hypothetical protein